MRSRSKSSDILTSLFDFSFREFVTIKLVKLIYGLAIVIFALLAVLLVTLGLSRSPLTALVALIFASLVFLFSITFVRICLELAVVFFRIADNTAEIAEHSARVAVNTSTPGQPAVESRSSDRQRES